MRVIPGLPRMRGGGPKGYVDVVKADVVFPACAGVVLTVEEECIHEAGLPRMRGGGPKTSAI